MPQSLAVCRVPNCTKWHVLYGAWFGTNSRVLFHHSWSAQARQLLLFLCASFAPCVAQGDTLYGVVNRGQLITIDPSTGAGTLVGNTGFSELDALELAPNGTLLAVAAGNLLISVDDETGAGQPIGRVTGYTFVESLAFGSGTLFGSASLDPEARAEQLIAIDAATGNASPIGNFGTTFTDVDGLARSPSGVLIGTHIDPQRLLFSVDPATGEGTLISSLSEVVTALDFATDGTLFGSTTSTAFGGPSRLVTINPATGEIADIGPIGFDTVTGIKFVPGDAAIPEPSSVTLFGMGVLGLLGLALRRLVPCNCLHYLNERYPKSRAILASIIAIAVLSGSSRADILLSNYVGGASGAAVTTSNPPFTTIVDLADYRGFGIDTAGAFSSGQLIDFADTTPFTKGIGAHPSSRIEFNLAVLRGIEPFDTFTTVVGIDRVANGGAGGATFTVLLDGTSVVTQDIVNFDLGSQAVIVPIGAQSTLTLDTQYFGTVFGNHAAWADARLSLGAVPEPNTLTLFTCSALVALLWWSHRRVKYVPLKGRVMLDLSGDQ